MSLEIKINNLDKIKNAYKKSPEYVYTELNQAIRSSVTIIRDIMRSETPFKSGELRRNIEEKVNKLKGQVGPNLQKTPYAMYIHNGTRPYTILPKNKQALYWQGARHPVKKVNHPGIRKNPFVDRTFDQVKRPVNEIFNKRVENILKKMEVK